jgi:hypothetical protein
MRPPWSRARAAELGRGRMVVRPAFPVLRITGGSPPERGRAGWEGVWPAGPVAQTHAEVRRRVEMCRQPPAGQIPHPVRPHRGHRVSGLVRDDQPQTGCGERELEQFQGRPAEALGPADRGGAHTDGGRQLSLAEVGAAACSAQGAGDVQAFGHASTLRVAGVGAGGADRICGRSGGLWISARLRGRLLLPGCVSFRVRVLPGACPSGCVSFRVRVLPGACPSGCMSFRVHRPCIAW